MVSSDGCECIIRIRTIYTNVCLHWWLSCLECPRQFHLLFIFYLPLSLSFIYKYNFFFFVLFRWSVYFVISFSCLWAFVICNREWQRLCNLLNLSHYNIHHCIDWIAVDGYYCVVRGHLRQSTAIKVESCWPPFIHILQSTDRNDPMMKRRNLIILLSCFWLCGENFPKRLWFCLGNKIYVFTDLLNL